MLYSGCRYKKKRSDSAILSCICCFIIFLQTQKDLYAGDYIDSNINISVSIGVGSEYNDITEKEDDIVYDQTGKPSGTTVLNAAYQLDLLTPPFITLAKGKFVIKAGLTGKIGTSLYEHSYNDDEISESIIDYNFWQVGPSMLFAYHHSVFDAGGIVYTYYGPISGDVHAVAVLREAGFPYSDSDCETEITGKKLNIGIRNFCALNKGVSIYGGGGLYYTRTAIILDHRLPVYGDDVGKEVITHGVGLELFFGIYF